MAGVVINTNVPERTPNSDATQTRSSLDNLLGVSDLLTEANYAKQDGIVTGAGGKGFSVQGTNSLFNPFHVFRYSLFGSTDGRSYDSELHKNIRSLSTTSTQGVADSNRLFAQSRTEIVENPSASAIIDWAKQNGDKNGSATIMGPAPYQWSDFLWCKYYGKIPNNKLLTLRRYPIPVEDNIQIAKEKMPLIPIAQAITWWGGDTGNTLDSALGMTFGLNWEPQKFGDVRSVDGNEITGADVLDAAGFKGVGESTRAALQALLFDNATNPYDQTGGYDADVQTWIKNSYGESGPYWNRVLGPVNVVETIQTRTRGLSFSKDISLTFTYKLRSYAGVNPKIAMLDLINNFLSLTYNNADFYGGAIRYFQKTGYILPGLPTTKFELGDYVGGIQDVVGYLMDTIGKKVQQLSAFVKEIGNSPNLSSAFNQVIKSQASQQLAGAWVYKLMQKPLQMRGFLDGRATGEWHLTVGNPLNPIATIGNLCLKQTTISFSDTLGLDDFPTEVKFTVQLTHGRDRARQDIASMFNLGGGPMYFSDLPDPSSARNSLGERNSIQANAARGNIEIPENTSNATTSNTATEGAITGGLSNYAADALLGASGQGSFSTGRNIGAAEAEKIAGKYKARIARAYGQGYSDSPMLTDYFRDIKTKD